ncbi:MAG: YsnF/AvaK domain-containing protein, partial [Catenulispora sp.]|nr:YsnF/AvaK domain-containing protein [Catenulispora sp.]
MITRDQVRAVIDRPVCDSDGNKIGDAKHVFLDDVTGEPEWVSVKTGLFGTHESFVPIREAAMVDGRLEVPYAKDTVKDAPNVDVDGGGHLSESEEHRLYEHYGIDWDSAWQRANEPGRDGWAAAGAAGAAAGTGVGAAGKRTSAMARVGDKKRDDAMTRSEERMNVGVERREAGRARLRKYVVTEEQEKTVPVRHEEVRLEREPITEANVDAA